jgi:hypothetical protein
VRPRRARHNGSRELGRKGVATRRGCRAFERAGQIAGNPSSVEVARLRPRAFIILPRGVRSPGIERDVVAQRLITRGGRWVAPGDRVRPMPGDDRIQVPRFALNSHHVGRASLAVSNLRRTSAGGM